MPPTSTQTHQHNLLEPSSRETISQALTILRPHLPISLPLYRRLQCGRFFPATTLLTNLNTLDTTPPLSSPWLLAFVDRTCRPETEVWLFGSWEVLHQVLTLEQTRSITSLLKSLVRTIKSFPLPTSLHADALSSTPLVDGVRSDSSGLSRTGYTSHLHTPNLTLWGAVHSRTAHLLQAADVIRSPAGSESGEGMVPNSTFLFDLEDGSVLLGVDDSLPDGLVWGKLQWEDFKLVRSRTQIPRQDRTLAGLPCVAIWDVREVTSTAGGGEDGGHGRGKPIAWAFVGLDGSLTTLHVEAEWRRRGLAQAITAKLFREEMEGLWEVGVKRWTHGYVVEGNVASEGLCRRLGGRKVWDAFWVRVDLDAAGEEE
ncbi:acetyltransferase like protein [Zymoseptoria brevis]|uniref:Acetyltransferase like protein n=1 Tax=Zymoseptoria brevis TaxID=1047168 RepID=A0A0F4GDI3_9PEZI|nr:acetyltransferase like protein [Zymoseptoria brevis]